MRPALSTVFDLGEKRYVAQVVPDLYPAVPQPVLKNWPAEDLEMHCGIYTDARRSELSGLPVRNGLTLRVRPAMTLQEQNAGQLFPSAVDARNHFGQAQP